MFDKKDIHICRDICDGDCKYIKNNKCCCKDALALEKQNINTHTDVLKIICEAIYDCERIGLNKTAKSLETVLHHLEKNKKEVA